MLQRYKEVFYGLLFGLGASVIDVFMHASMEQQGFWMELIHPQPIMVAYRVFFIAFGLALGWLLWRKNKVERAFRSVMQTGVTTSVEYFCEPIDTWVDIQVCPTDEGIALYYRDITGRKRLV